MDAQQAMTLARDEWGKRRKTIAAIARYLDVGQRELAREMGLHHQVLHERLSGRTEIKPWELDGFAAVLGVPLEVLFMEPDEALRSVLDHAEWGLPWRERTRGWLVGSAPIAPPEPFRLSA